MLQSDPCASPDTIRYTIILKSQLNTIHWQIAENQNIDQHWKNKQIAYPVFFQQTHTALPFFSFFSNSHFLLLIMK